MSFLAPLYVAGALAIALPILFHLIRRTPQGRQDFSSLMFLAPSPPRITRRSRLNNIILLLLRAAALALLAFAFARPFLRADAGLNVPQQRGRRVAILIDTSASMRRGDLFPQALRQAEQVVSSLSPSDEAALYWFDRAVRPALTFAEWNETEPSRRAAVLRSRLAGAAPTWDSTNIGEALATAADLLAEGEGPQKDASGAGAGGVARQLVLISDMQQGGHAEALQGHQWPQGVLLEVKPVVLKHSANAGLLLVRDAPGGAPSEGADPTRLRVRVGNAPDSTKEQFTLAWAGANGPLANTPPVKAYVPPGRSQVVRVPWPASGQAQAADRLVLGGDDFDFDNTVYVVPPRKETVRVVYVGDEGPDDAKQMRYYFASAAAGTATREVDLVARRPDEALGDVELLGARLAVVSGALPNDKADALRRFAESGGDVLWVMKDPDSASGVARVMGVAPPDVRESAGNFALISRVDFDHPLFAPFADTRFGDFTKIHFWKHRRVRLDAPAQGAGSPRVVASFDNGDPFLFEQPVGRGRLLVMTSGWHPADSQLALSTKFVPLVSALLRRKDDAAVEAQYVVHQPVALPKAQGGAPDASGRTVTGPDGKPVALAASATTFDGAAQPGIYRLSIKGQETPVAVAVNVAPDESRTAPLAVEELEQYGARLGSRPEPEALATRQRQLQVAELENRQKLWRWLIVGVLTLLAAETALAGGLARRALRREQAGEAPAPA